MSGFYVLDGRVPRPVEDARGFARWFGSADRQVARTEIGPVLVSTVFLGVDHSFGQGRPLLFETMVFGSDHPDLDGYQERYSDWENAEIGHQKAVALVRSLLGETGQPASPPTDPPGQP